MKADRFKTWLSAGLFVVACGGTSINEPGGDAAQGAGGSNTAATGATGGRNGSTGSGAVGGTGIAGGGTTGGYQAGGGDSGEPPCRFIRPEGEQECWQDPTCFACLTAYTDACFDNAAYRALQEYQCAHPSMCWSCQLDPNGAGGEAGGGA